MPIHEKTRLAFRPSGLAVLALALLLFLFGLLKVDGVGMTVGLTIALALGWAAWVAKRNLCNLEAHLSIPTTVTVGVEFPVGLRLVALRRRHDAFAVRAELHLAGLRESYLEIPWLAAGSAVQPESQVSLPKRGYFGMHPLRLSSTFPFGWFEVECWTSLDDPVEVKPRLSSPRSWLESGLGSARDGRAARPSAAFLPGGDWRGLRSWRVGDSPRRIHWPASLRQPFHGEQGGWMVRDEEPPGADWNSCLVVFHSWGNRGELIRLDRFERAISLMGGLMHHLRRSGCRCRWTADFVGWRQYPTESTAQWQCTMELLTRATRSAETEWHQVVDGIDTTNPSEAVLVVSDVPMSAWAMDLPEREDLHAFSPPWTAETTRLLHPR